MCKCFALDSGLIIQEVFHVYLNKFYNAVTHLFLIILGTTDSNG